MTSILAYLEKNGPTRSANLVAMLVDQGVAPVAARQRISRLKLPFYKFPLTLLPKNESFVYLAHQRNREVFWDNFQRDLRETKSIFGLAIDGLVARGGGVAKDQFGVISGAPINPMKGQLHSDRVLDVLVKAGFVKIFGPEGEEAIHLVTGGGHDYARDMGELVLMDALREWTRKLGFASYNTLAIRREPELKPIGPFQFDIAGPSYFSPLHDGGKPGFFVADVFAQGTLNEHHIQYFIRKVSVLRAMKMGIKLMPILVSESFTGSALTAGHAAGISLATPTILFGRRAGAAMASLVQTLKNAAAFASSESPDRIVRLLNDLTEIEGRAGNLRGVLFELMVAYLSRRNAASIDMGTIARDPDTGLKADIDILKVTHMSAEATCIECKGKEPGGVVSLAEVKNWLAKVATMRSHLRGHPALREATHRFELWTSGTFAPDALVHLQSEKALRTKAPIDWKDGNAVLALARGGKEKAMADAFEQHFSKHPLAEVALQLEKEPALIEAPLADALLTTVGPSPFGGWQDDVLPDDPF